MNLVVIGTYEDHAQALSAKHELLASGFSRGDVQLNPDDELTGAHSPRSGPESKTASGSSIGDLFNAMFGTQQNKSTYSNLYADAVRRGDSVLTVEVSSETDCARARQIMSGHGPVDIEERSADWVWHGWRGHDPEKASASKEGGATQKGRERKN